MKSPLLLLGTVLKLLHSVQHLLNYSSVSGTVLGTEDKKNRKDTFLLSDCSGLGGSTCRVTRVILLHKFSQRSRKIVSTSISIRNSEPIFPGMLPTQIFPGPM